MILEQLLMQAYNVSAIGINVWAFQVARDVAGVGGPLLTSVMSILAQSYLVILPLIAFYLYFKKDLNVYTMIITGIVIYVIADIIKLIVMEPRPCTIPGEVTWINNISTLCESSTFSFPSEHASTLTGLIFFVKNYNYLKIAYVVWLLLVLFGRIYLGAHYLTDVIAGMALSMVGAYVIFHYKDLLNKIANDAVKKIMPGMAIIANRKSN